MNEIRKALADNLALEELIAQTESVRVGSVLDEIADRTKSRVVDFEIKAAEHAREIGPAIADLDLKARERDRLKAYKRALEIREARIARKLARKKLERLKARARRAAALTRAIKARVGICCNKCGKYPCSTAARQGERGCHYILKVDYKR